MGMAVIIKNMAAYSDCLEDVVDPCDCFISVATRIHYIYSH